MMLTDAIGNPLSKDDLVVIKMGDQQMIGILLEIKEPSVLSSGKDSIQMAGVVRFSVFPMTFSYDMRNPRLTEVIKAVKPPNFGKQES